MKTKPFRGRALHIQYQYQSTHRIITCVVEKLTGTSAITSALLRRRVRSRWQLWPRSTAESRPREISAIAVLRFALQGLGYTPFELFASDSGARLYRIILCFVAIFVLRQLIYFSFFLLWIYSLILFDVGDCPWFF